LPPRPQVDIAERLPEEPGNLMQEDERGETVDATLDDLPELQKSLISAILKHGNQNRVNDMAFAAACRDRRLYKKGVQHFYWNGQLGQVVFEYEIDTPYDRTFNISLPYNKIFVATFMGARPKVEPEPDNSFDISSIQDTEKARDYERIWRKNNDMSELQLHIGDLFWSDGRIITETEQREDGEYTRIYGGLESRISGFIDRIDQATLLETEEDIPLVTAKRQYPDKKKDLNSGAGDAFFRAQRIAVRRVSKTDDSIDIYTGEDGTGLCTITKSRVAPDFYEHLKDDETEQLNQMYPDGVMVVRSGDTFLEAYPYSITATCDVIHAIKSDGMNGPALASPLMNVQDSVNTAGNLTEETFDQGIPVTYYGQRTNIDTLNSAHLAPGASRKMLLEGDQKASDQFFVTPALQPSTQLLNYWQTMTGQFAQFVTGLPPVIQGFGDDHQQTSSGQTELKNLALGQMAIVWKPFTSWYTREMNRACKLAAQRTDDITSILEPTTAWGKRRPVRITPAELKGMKYTNASDENFPQSYTDKRNVFMGLMQDPDTKQWLMQSPDNLYLAKQLIGLPELVIPGEDPRNKQLQEISEMRDSGGPVPVMPEGSPMLPAVGAAPITYPNPNVQWKSSVEVVKYDVDETEYAECMRWINSTEGQDAKRNEPLWYADVCLHADAHEEQMKQKAAANAPAPEEKPPSISVSVPLDKFSPEIQAQVFEKFGIQVTQPPVAPETIQ
jgi:hypothetical protein